AHSRRPRQHAERDAEGEPGDRDRRDRPRALEVTPPHVEPGTVTPRAIRSRLIVAQSPNRTTAAPVISHRVAVNVPVRSRTPPRANGAIAPIVYPTPSMSPAIAP